MEIAMAKSSDHAPIAEGPGKARVRRITPPPESVVAGSYENASLLDSYSIDLSSSKQEARTAQARRRCDDDRCLRDGLYRNSSRQRAT